MSVEDELAAIALRADAAFDRSRVLLDEARSSFRGSDSPVSVQRASANRKMAPQRRVLARNGRIRNEPAGPFVVTTYVSIAATCPDSCAFKSGGCYAIAGATHLTLRGLDRAALDKVGLEVTQAEADALDGLWRSGIPQDGARGGRDLRLHVAGEVSCRKGAERLGDTARRWKARRGGRIWTYTHRWREIPRKAWGPISVLASCETPADARAANAAGYAVAVVVPTFPDGARSFSYAGRRAIPCPAEVAAFEREDSEEPLRITCSQCRLCMDDAKLRDRGLVIAFATHGADSDDAAAKLVQLRRR